MRSNCSKPGAPVELFEREEAPHHVTGQPEEKANAALRKFLTERLRPDAHRPAPWTRARSPR
jgi:hypothetical protein